MLRTVAVLATLVSSLDAFVLPGGPAGGLAGKVSLRYSYLLPHFRIGHSPNVAQEQLLNPAMPTSTVARGHLHLTARSRNKIYECGADPWTRAPATKPSFQAHYFR